MNTQPTRTPVTKPANSLQQAYWYHGCLVNVLVDGSQTDGRYAQLEMTMQPGVEPPLHTHTREDETFYLLEGSVEFTIGQHMFVASPGDYVFMPRHIKHGFRVLTPTVKTILTIAPAGFEQYFIDPRSAQPATSLTLPPLPQGPPSPEAIAGMVTMLHDEFGVQL